MVSVPEIICVGPLIVDDIKLANGELRENLPGGSVSYSSLGARTASKQVGMVGVCGKNYPESFLREFEARQIQTLGIRRNTHTSHTCKIEYDAEFNSCQTQELQSSLTQVSPTPSDFPESWKLALAVHTSAYPIHLQAEMIRYLSTNTNAALSLDIRTAVTNENLDAILGVVSEVDIFLPGENEIGFFNNDDELQTTLKAFAVGRIQYIVLKRGPKGVSIFDRKRDQVQHVPIKKQVRVVDPTGAGDAFCGAFMSRWIQGKEMMNAVHKGMEASACTIQAWGPYGLLEARS